MQGSRIRAISYDISLGNGDDDFSFEGNQKALPGHTDVTVHGNFGNDDLTADLNGSVVGGFTILNLYGDAGDDDISTYANGTDIVNSFANLDIQLDGNAGDDTLEAFYRGENDGHLTVQLSGGTNSDHVSADVTFDTGSTGWMSSSFVDGGDGNDFLKFFVRKTASDPIAINAEFSGGLGFDSGLISDDYVQHDNSTESLSTV
jgi:hypothetical protein